MSPPVAPQPSPLLTDLYQLTMMQGYFAAGLHTQTAVFDLYFRRLPYQGGYAVWAGLEEMLETLESLRFTAEELAYLETLGLFQPDFLTALRDWRFSGQIDAFAEGSVVFAYEPLLTVTAPLWEAQLVETMLLNTLNFQTLVATKAARCVLAAQSSPHGGEVIEFGARRAQGPDGALSAARAAFVGGATGTSNVQAGQRFGLPLTGTHAHAWVESFPDELGAFRAYARVYPDSTTLLLDTVDTLASGLPNALTVARELRAAGHELRGVRLDSGDLAYLSRTVRAALDAAGFGDVKIVASNDLSESVIAAIIAEGGRVDVYGVGTQLATAGGPGGGALGGVYKLAAAGRPAAHEADRRPGQVQPAGGQAGVARAGRGRHLRLGRADTGRRTAAGTGGQRPHQSAALGPSADGLAVGRRPPDRPGRGPTHPACRPAARYPGPRPPGAGPAAGRNAPTAQPTRLPRQPGRRRVWPARLGQRGTEGRTGMMG